MPEVIMKETGLVSNISTTPTEPWNPARILEHDQKPGFRLKWVRRDLIDRFKAEGWKLCSSNDKVADKTPSTIIDGTPIDSSVQKRELVLMEITEALAKSRDAYYKSLTDGALNGSVDEFKRVAQEGSGRSYGEVTIVKGGA